MNIDTLAFEHKVETLVKETTQGQFEILNNDISKLHHLIVDIEKSVKRLVSFIGENTLHKFETEQAAKHSGSEMESMGFFKST